MAQGRIKKKEEGRKQEKGKGRQRSVKAEDERKKLKAESPYCLSGY